MEIRLIERLDRYSLIRSRFGHRCTFVAKNGGVDTTNKAGSSKVGVSTNPVVGDGLVGIQDERISLASEDLDAVNSVRSVIYTVNLNDSLASSNRSKFD